MVISIYCECPMSMFLTLGYEEKNRGTTLVIKISMDSKDINGESNKLLPRTYKFSDFGYQQGLYIFLQDSFRDHNSSRRNHIQQ